MAEPSCPTAEAPRRVRPSAIVLTALLVLVGGLVAALRTSWASDGIAVEAGVRYIAKRSDAICGLSDVRLLSNPARVRYEELLDATPERARLRKEGIDPGSPLGQILESEARRRVTAASTVVMRRGTYCSVWKGIRRSDGRSVPDITLQVLPELERVTPPANEESPALTDSGR